MLTTKNELTILYEGKEKQISIGSTIKQLEQEFINKFQTQKNINYYFYYKINNDIEIILTEESFNDFIDLNITTLFADKKEEKNIRDGDLELNSQKIDSGLDLFIVSNFLFLLSGFIISLFDSSLLFVESIFVELFEEFAFLSIFYLFCQIFFLIFRSGH